MTTSLFGFLRISPIKRLAPSLVIVALFAAGAFAHDRTMSFNSDVPVLPAPGVVVVDGETDDWDLSGGIWSYNDPTLVDRHSVWTHLMWDANGVYMLARCHDLTPLKNDTSGEDFQQSWRADCYQARVVFDPDTDDEHQMHIDLFHSSRDDRPYMIVKHGGFRDKPPYDDTGPDRPDQLERWGSAMDKAGGRIAFKAWEDGKGYNLEAFWPWSYCRTSGKALKPGESFVFGTEAMWGNVDGTRMVHRLADGIKDDAVNRIFMFRARSGWGSATLRAEGNLDVADEQRALQAARLKNFVDYDTHGSVPIAYALPEARDVSIVIDDAQGRRVRCLFGQRPRDAGDVEDLWDCLDDDGNPVPPGDYKATIVHHKPISISFVNSVYSSATPPWVTEEGTKLWGANHGHPTSVATRGSDTLLIFTGTEGGSGIQKIDDNGIIQWADGNEFLDATLDDTYAYGLSRSSWQTKTLLFRFNLKNGAIVPFDDAARTPSPTLLSDADIPNESTIAIGHGKLWALIPGRALLRIDRSAGAVEAELPVGDLVAVTDRDDTLFGLCKDGRVVALDAEAEQKDVFKAKGLKRPVRFGVSHDGKRFAISDMGSNQVVVFRSNGKRLHVIGRAYEADDRPAGAFVPTDLICPLGADFDHLGRLWIAEAVKSCKRVTCWSADGALLDQYWGQADYGAMAGFPLTFDSTRFVAHGIEFKLDPDPNPWQRKTCEQPLRYHPELAEERGLVYKVGDDEYACGAPGYNKPSHLKIFKRAKDGVFRPVVTIALGGQRRVDGKLAAFGARAWTDLNENGKEDAGEVVEDVDMKGLYWSNGWVRPDLAILAVNGVTFAPTGFTATGVPRYDFTSPTQVPNWIAPQDAQGSAGTPVIDDAGNISDGIAYHTVDGRSGKWPNRYGRHDAPAAQRGVLIAPFRCNGVVEQVPGVGSITALGGDRGEWFLMTMDGIYLSSICQDSKGQVVLDETFIGQESFGGFIWRDAATGKVLVQLGGASYRIMQVDNLESCRKVAVDLTVGESDLKASAEILAKRRQAVVREPDSLRIARVRQMPGAPAPVMQPLSTPLIAGAVDVRVAEQGNPAQWFRASLAHNGRDLAAMFQVADPSPWMNAAGAFTHAFIGGDAVDVQLNVPGRGPIRLLAASVGGKPTAIYWQAESEAEDNAITYAVGNNMANATSFPVVRRLDQATVKVGKGFNAYTCLITVPLAELGLNPAEAEGLTGVVGVIYSTPAGDNRASRLYWHDKKTGLVSDVPSEARLTPKAWGPILMDK
ncbi:MAG: FlgD immunoglobulin-like domain containing protein [Kiritimatiellia bacterium]